MTERLGAMYHWSPKRLRREILRDGLKVMSENQRGDTVPPFPWICLAPTPSAAWGYLPASMTREENLPLDLWMVRLGDYTRTQIITTDGPNIHEVRVFQSIPPDRIWWVAERRWQAHDTMPLTAEHPSTGDGDDGLSTREPEPDALTDPQEPGEDEPKCSCGHDRSVHAMSYPKYRGRYCKLCPCTGYSRATKEKNHELADR